MTQVRRHWLVVNTHPHKEMLAMTNAANQGFSAYCPVIRRSVRHARKTRYVLRPLFPGYMFIEGPFESRGWRPLLSTFGVRSVVRSGEEPCRVDPQFIDALKARELDGIIVSPRTPYAVGQQVRIVHGPFQDTVATILTMDEKERLVVLMDVLNRPVRVRLDVRQITA